MKNIEIKIKFIGQDQLKDVTDLLKENNAEYKGILNQSDTYFNCSMGRLKIRGINNEQFELIFYTRPDSFDEEISNIQIMTLTKEDADKLKDFFSKALGIFSVITKRRELWIYKNTRIHLDIVQNLGYFMELETVIGADEGEALKEYKEISSILKIDNHKKISGSYSDLVNKNNNY